MSAEGRGGVRSALSVRTQLDHRIEYVLRAIEADSSRDIPELARMVNLSPSRLSHLFKLNTRRPLRAYVTRLRLEAAAKSLVSGDESVKAISYIVGYSHPASFIRAFQKHFHCSPTDYRESWPARRVVGRNP